MSLPQFQDVLLQHQVLIQRLSTNEVNKFRPFLQTMDRALRDALAEVGVSTFRKARLNQLLLSVDALMAGVLDKYTQKLFADLEAYANHEARFSTGVLEDLNLFETLLPSPAQVRAAILSTPLGVKGAGRGALLKAFVDDWTTAETKAVNGAIRRGAFEGKTNQDIIRELRGSHDFNYQDGLLNVTRRHAEAVVRTAVQHVATIAREESFTANKDLVQAYRWLATLDARTCPSCAALDGHQYGLDAGPRPPLHINCRCTLLPVLKEQYSFLATGATRASKGAEGGQQVDAGLTYYQWLKTQPPAFQDLAIGPSRGKLFREGGLSAERFAKLQIDKNFAPMTLEEMQALEPRAFKRAGVAA